MFEVSAWCIVVTVVLATGVWLDDRRHQPLWRRPAAVWVILVGLTCVRIVPYVIARVREPVPVGAR